MSNARVNVQEMSGLTRPLFDYECGLAAKAAEQPRTIGAKAVNCLRQVASRVACFVISLFIHFEAAIRLVKTAVTRNAIERNIQWKKCCAAYAVCLLSLRACWDQTVLLARASVSLPSISVQRLPAPPAVSERAPAPLLPARDAPVPLPQPEAQPVPVAVPLAVVPAPVAVPLPPPREEERPVAVAVAEAPVRVVAAPPAAAAPHPAPDLYLPRPEAQVGGRNSPHNSWLAAALVREALDEEMGDVRRAQRREGDGFLFHQSGSWRCLERDPRWGLSSQTIGTATVGMCHFAHPEQALKGEFISLGFDLKIGERTYPVQLFAAIQAIDGPSAAQFVKNRLPAVLSQLLQNHNVEALSEEGIHRALKSVFAELDRQFRTEHRKFIDRFSGRSMAQDGAAVALALCINGEGINEQVWTANLGNGRVVLVHNEEAIRLCRGALSAGAAAEEEIEAIGLDHRQAVRCEPRITVRLLSPGDQLVLGSRDFFNACASTEELGAILTDAARRREAAQEALRASSHPGERGAQAIREALHAYRSRKEEAEAGEAEAGRAKEAELSADQIRRLRTLWGHAERGAPLGQDRILQDAMEKTHPETLAAELVYAAQPRHLEGAFALSCMIVELDKSKEPVVEGNGRGSPVHSWNGECPPPAQEAGAAPGSPAAGSEGVMVEPPTSPRSSLDTPNSWWSYLGLTSPQVAAATAAAAPAAAPAPAEQGAVVTEVDASWVPTAIPAEPAAGRASQAVSGGLEVPTAIPAEPSPQTAGGMGSPGRSEAMSAEQTPAHGALQVTSAAAQAAAAPAEPEVVVRVVPDDDAELGLFARAWHWIGGNSVTPPGGPAGSASSTAPTSPNGSGPAAPEALAAAGTAEPRPRTNSASSDGSLVHVPGIAGQAAEAAILAEGAAGAAASPRPPSVESVPFSVAFSERRPGSRRNSASSEGSLVPIHANEAEAQILDPGASAAAAPAAPGTARSFSDEDWDGARRG